MMESPDNEWFREWFDSPYYHILYRHRDESEARRFVGKLLTKINLKDNSHILDLACGKGRHSMYLHSLGYDVTGIDLSERSISVAKTHEKPGLHFQVEDMRHFDLAENFDCIVNLFTSFGYFNEISENKLVLKKVKEHLKPEGIFVLDYFNARKVMSQLDSDHFHTCDLVNFEIKKYIRDNQIIKEIGVVDGKNKFEFHEKVQLLTSTQIESMFHEAGLTTIGIFGDYELGDFQDETSDRFIIIASN